MKAEKRRKVTIKTHESEIVITAEDIYAIALTFVAIIVATAAVVLLAVGRTDHIFPTLSFLSGIGLSDAVRRLVYKWRGGKKK